MPVAADESRRNINDKREHFRPVAIPHGGSLLYLSIVDMLLLSGMHASSLAPLEELLMNLKSMDLTEKTPRSE